MRAIFVGFLLGLCCAAAQCGALRIPLRYTISTNGRKEGDTIACKMFNGHCNDCTEVKQCGYCGGTGLCEEGTFLGPNQGEPECNILDWHWRANHCSGTGTPSPGGSGTPAPSGSPSSGPRVKFLASVALPVNHSTRSTFYYHGGDNLYLQVPGFGKPDEWYFINMTTNTTAMQEGPVGKYLYSGATTGNSNGYFAVSYGNGHVYGFGPDGSSLYDVELSELEYLYKPYPSQSSNTIFYRYFGSSSGGGVNTPSHGDLMDITTGQTHLAETPSWIRQAHFINPLNYLKRSEVLLYPNYAYLSFHRDVAVYNYATEKAVTNFSHVYGSSYSYLGCHETLGECYFITERFAPEVNNTVLVTDLTGAVSLGKFEYGAYRIPLLQPGRTADGSNITFLVNDKLDGLRSRLQIIEFKSGTLLDEVHVPCALQSGVSSNYPGVLSNTYTVHKGILVLFPFIDDSSTTSEENFFIGLNYSTGETIYNRSVSWTPPYGTSPKFFAPESGLASFQVSSTRTEIFNIETGESVWAGEGGRMHLLGDGSSSDRTFAFLYPNKETKAGIYEY